MKRKLLSILLALSMCLSLLPTMAWADNEVAQVGETKFETLAAAITYVCENDTGIKTITMIGNTTENVTIPSNKKITLDLNGKTIDGDQAGSVITVDANGELTVKDSSADNEDGTNGTGKITNGKSNSGGGITNNGKLTLLSGHITKNENTTTGGTYGGGGVYNGPSATFVMNGGSISENIATKEGGGIQVSGGSSFTMTKGIIEKNTCTGATGGGGIYAGGDATVAISGGTIQENTAPGSGAKGGGICSYGADIEISGNTIIQNNKAYSQGGGIGTASDTEATLEITGGTIINNESTNNYGGDIGVTGKTFATISGGVIGGENSKCYESYGTAIYRHDADKGGITINGSVEVNGNVAVGYNSTATTATAEISGGRFTEKIVSGGMTGFISGGVYTDAAKDATDKDLIKSGYNFIANTDENTKTNYPWMVGMPPVAQNVNTGVKYTTVQKAVSAAKSGETIKLLKDVNYGSEERQGIVIGSSADKADKEITIDLNGKTYEGVFTYGAFIAQYGKLTIKDSSDQKTGVICNNSETNKYKYAALCATSRGTIVLESGTVEGYAFGIYQYSVNDSALGNTTIINGGEVEVEGYALGVFDYGTLKINGGKVTSNQGYAICNNGSDVADSTMIITGGEIYGAGEAIYHPGPGTLTISGGTLIGGETGIEMRAGTLNVTGGTINGNGTPTEITPNGNGMTSKGAGIAIAQHTTKLPISVNISGGEINGFSALYESNPQNNGADDIAKVSVAVTGGKFKAINGGTVIVYSENKTGFINAGLYSEVVPAAYIKTGYCCIDNTDEATKQEYPHIVTAQYGVASIGTTMFVSVEDAMAAAQDGDTVKLLAESAAAVTVTLPLGVTFDTNGHSFKGTVNAPDALHYVDETDGVYSIGTYIAKANSAYYKTLDEAIKANKKTNNVIDILVDDNQTITAAAELAASDYFHVYQADCSKYVFGDDALPENCVKTAYNTTTTGVDRFDVEPYVAQNVNTGVKYTALDAAVKGAKSGETVKLLKDIGINYQGIGNKDVPAKNITVNFDGHSVTSAYFAFYIAGTSAVTLENGTIISNYGGVEAKDTANVILKNMKLNCTDSAIQQFSQSTVTIDKDTVVTSTATAKSGYPLISFADKDTDATHTKTLNVYGKVYGNYLNAFKGNGTNKATSAVNIYEGAVMDSNTLLFYVPEPCLINVYGGTLSGYAAFGIKSGTLNISGGEVIGKANDTELSDGNSDDNGINNDGSAIVIDSNLAYAGKLKINITGGTVKGNYAYAIHEIGDNASQNIVSLKISGGKVFGGETANKQTMVIRPKTKTDGVVSLTGGYYTDDVSAYVASAYQCVPLSADQSAAGYDVNYSALIGEGYTHKVTLITTKPTPTSGPVITVEYDDAKQQTEYHSDTEAAVESAKESTAKATVTVESNTNASFTTTIDDTVTIIVEDTTKVDATVTADPGYELNAPVEEGTKKTYTAEELEIGFGDKEKTTENKGNGTTETKQTTAKVAETSVSATEAVKTAAATVTEKETESATVIETVAKEAAAAIKQGTAAKALNALPTTTVTNEGTGGATAAKDVSVFVDTYYQTEVKKDETTRSEAEKSFTLNITPMYQAYATTYTVTADTTLNNLTIGTDTAPIGEPKKLDMTDKIVTMKVQLPDGFITSTSDKVYVKHITASGAPRFYDTIVTKEGDHFFATFTNPDGFSEFVFTRESLEPPTPPTGGGGGGAATYAVSVASAANGKVSVDKKSAAAGATVTVTVTSAEGYKLGTLSAKDAKGNAVTLTKSNDTTYTFKMPAAAVTVTATFAKAAADGVCPKDATCPIEPFTDTKNDEWWHDGIHYCVENGMMNGFPGSVFKPNDPLSRAQIVTMLWRLEGSPVVNYAMSFADVPSYEWFVEPVRWAQSTGVVTGYDAESFGPNDNVTREQLAAILYRYAAYKGIDVSARADLAKFTDTASISDWAVENVKWANAVGMVNGRTETTIVPTGTATRAEAAAMFQRFCENVIK